jgi:ribokinase
MDLIVRTETIPTPGQTVLGHNFSTLPGGKGANQAIAAALCGAQVSMIARVGNDDFGERLLLGLNAHQVNTQSVRVSEAISTGTAMIIVNSIGENSICVAAGANALLNLEDIDEHLETLAQADLVLLQLEIPLETAVYTIQQAQRYKIPVILNPAPAPAPTLIPPQLFDADILIPNEHELAQLSCQPPGPVDGVLAAKRTAFDLIDNYGVKTVVTTLGHRGAIGVTNRQDSIHVPAFKHKIVDTTGAGDAFCGAFAVDYARDRDLNQAMRFASAAGALACTKFGAQPAMPHLSAIEKLLQRSC